MRFDGNYGFNNKRGLYFDSKLRIDYKNDWYLFDLRNRGNNKIVIRNVKTQLNHYIIIACASHTPQSIFLYNE